MVVSEKISAHVLACHFVFATGHGSTCERLITCAMDVQKYKAYYLWWKNAVSLNAVLSVAGIIVGAVLIANFMIYGTPITRKTIYLQQLGSPFRFSRPEDALSFDWDSSVTFDDSDFGQDQIAKDRPFVCQHTVEGSKLVADDQGLSRRWL